MILVRNDHGHQRIALDFEGSVIDSIIYALLDLLSRNTAALIMGHDGSCSRLKGVQLALRVAGGGFLMTAPVVQHLRNMTDFLCSLGAAEDKIIVLGTVKLVPEAAHLI